MKLKLKIFWKSSMPKIIGIIASILLLLCILILPTVLYSRPKGSIIGYNRDATSGTRGAFAELVLDEKEFSPGRNIREVKGNEQMIQNVNKNLYSLGYVSLSTVAEFNGDTNLILKNRNNKIPNYKIAALNDVIPTKENLNNGSYSAARDFNMFFRTEKNSEESKILNYDWTANKISTDVSNLSENLKASYLFYEWAIYSQQAANYLSDNGQIASTTTKFDLNNNVAQTYYDNVNLNAKNDDIKIDIVGSTSAIDTINLLKKEFLNEFQGDFKSIEISIDTNGSGDAFKKTIPGINESYIGMQSRAFEENEITQWGWTSADVPYGSFAKDAIAIIYNSKEGLDKIDSNKYRNIKSESIKKLYLEKSYMNYDDIFEEVLV